MKKIVLLLVFAFGSTLMADYVEVRDSSGRYYDYTRSKPRLYVCYDSRIKHISRGTMYLRYDGCARYRNSCAYNDKVRFGRYPTVRAAKNALYRCKTARPRFID